MFLIVTDSSCKGKAACDLTRWNDIQFHDLILAAEKIGRGVRLWSEEVNLMALSLITTKDSRPFSNRQETEVNI